MMYVIVRHLFTTTPETITIIGAPYSTEKEAVKAARADCRKLKARFNATTATDTMHYFDMTMFDCYNVETGQIYADYRVVAVTKFDLQALLDA